MNDEKWADVVDKIREKFTIVEENVNPMFDIPNGKTETFVFDSPVGKFKLVRTTMPRVIDKKTTYSNRIGSGVNVEYNYSKDEFVSDLKIYKFDELIDDWRNAALEL